MLEKILQESASEGEEDEMARHNEVVSIQFHYDGFLLSLHSSLVLQ